MSGRSIACALIVIGATGLVQAQNDAPTRPPAVTGGSESVLAVYSDDRLLYANQQVEAGFREALGSADREVALFSEFMDAVRFPAARHREAFRDYLAAKYRETPLRVIVAAGRPALDFLIDHRHSLFPGIPIVFEGIAENELPRDRMDAGIVGLPGSWDLGRSLDLALRLQPDTSHVVVINGVSPREQLMLGSVPDRAKQQSTLSFTWLTQHTMAEIVTTVKALGPRTVVLFGTLMEDASGAIRLPRDALEEVARVSAAPIYGQFESYVGYGIVGSYAETWHAAGTEAAGIVLRILDGLDPQAAVAGRRMPVSTIVDWREIERWGLTRADLPADTVVRYREPTLWESHRTLLLVFAAIGAVQLTLIVALVTALQRRRLAEARRLAAQDRASQLRSELAHATRVTTLGELTATLAHDINQPLAAILSNAQAARRWLQREPPDLQEVRASLDDIVADGKRSGDIVHDLRAMLKKSPQPHVEMDLRRVASDVSALLHGEIVASEATLELDVPDTPVNVQGNLVEIQQVVVNLMLNALQAMREHGSRPRILRVQVGAAEGRAFVQVRDTGPGLSADARTRLFQPFFTTRAAGLGMGLSICRRIAESHGGSLDLVETGDAGSVFALRMPAGVRSA